MIMTFEDAMVEANRLARETGVQHIVWVDKELRYRISALNVDTDRIIGYSFPQGIPTYIRE